MNYTENYHLPQWDEHDRIMRSDFNQMCADIEAGLAGNARTATGLQQSSAVQEKRTLSRLCRVAYNHYRAVQGMNPMPQQIGVFWQDPAKVSSHLTGTQLLNGIHCAWNCTGTLTAEMVEACFQELTPLHVVKGNLGASSPMTASFRPPVSGKINVFNMPGVYNNNNAPSHPRFRVSLINQDSGAVELVQEITADFTGSAAAMVNNTLGIPITFLGGVNYLFQVESLDAVCDMDIHFVPYTRSGLQTYTNGGTADAAWTIREPEGGEGGMVILHCLTAGTGGALTFSWDGQVRQPAITRRAPAGKGQTWQELIYWREDAIEQETSLSLHVACAEGGSFQFCDWGAVLF